MAPREWRLYGGSSHHGGEERGGNKTLGLADIVFSIFTKAADILGPFYNHRVSGPDPGSIQYYTLEDTPRGRHDRANRYNPNVHPVNNLLST